MVECVDAIPRNEEKRGRSRPEFPPWVKGRRTQRKKLSQPPAKPNLNNLTRGGNSNVPYSSASKRANYSSFYGMYDSLCYFCSHSAGGHWLRL